LRIETLRQSAILANSRIDTGECAEKVAPVVWFLQGVSEQGLGRDRSAHNKQAARKRELGFDVAWREQAEVTDFDQATR